MSVRYVPFDSAAYYGHLHGLAGPYGQIGSYDTVSNPSDAVRSGELRFFQPDKASDQAIAFVLQALELDVDALSDRETVTIRERETAFEVEVSSPHTGSSYTVAKGTGEILSHIHSHYLPPPEGPDDEKLEELVD